MIKTKLTLTALLLMVSTTSLLADPISTNYTAEPEPVHGLQDLEKHTNYPDFEQKLRHDGYVVLNFHVDVLGNVSNIEVAQSAGPLFDQAAIDAVRSTKWNPAMQNGTAIPVTFQLPFEFYSK